MTCWRRLHDWQLRVWDLILFLRDWIGPRATSRLIGRDRGQFSYPRGVWNRETLRRLSLPIPQSSGALTACRSTVMRLSGQARSSRDVEGPRRSRVTVAAAHLSSMNTISVGVHVRYSA